jgi:hypothetical protein
MKSIFLAFISLVLFSSIANADSISSKQVLKEVGKGKFVTTNDGIKFCTHEETVFAFSESQKNLGLNVLNKETGEEASYFLSDLTFSTNLKGTIFEKNQGNSQFPKFILINSSTYYFNSLSVNSPMEKDNGFMFKRIYDVNKNTSTLYCTKQ